MSLTRLVRHLSTGRTAVRTAFPAHTLDAIENVIRETEQVQAGQIRFAVEPSLDFRLVLAGRTARDRAVEVFSELRVWDTEHNNGVLIYLLLADHDVEIVADRGVHGKVGNAPWEDICHRMELDFREGRFEQGMLAGIRSVGRQLAIHYPSGGGSPNELPDRPVIL